MFVSKKKVIDLQKDIKTKLSMFVSRRELIRCFVEVLEPNFQCLFHGKIYIAVKGHMIIFPAFNVCFAVT
ncbi:MAG: hypothetical protein DRJ40_06245 [Thermoprotei archaeon]|nr:MAG: hypothetical protein DRJ40_06245 [Thermoprotei archaeon]